MAHSAAAARARFAGDVNRSRGSSPVDDNAYATATSFNDIIHSTPQARLDNTTSLPQEQLPIQLGQHPEAYEFGSDASAEMSIEIGRGGKRTGIHDAENISSNAPFGYGNDNSQYEITGTPPPRPRTSHRKSDGTLRKEASLRRATESTKANDALRRSTGGAKQRAVSDNMSRFNVETESQEATFTVRNNRFTSTRHLSTSYAGIPTHFSATGGLQIAQNASRQPAAGNPTVQSATYTTNQSFNFPNIPNLTELVSDDRKDGTPAFKRPSAPRSRFTSASYNPQSQSHRPVEGIVAPEEERVLYASIKLLGDRNAQLEMEKSDAQKHAEEYEMEIISLRNQLQEVMRRPGSAFASDEGSSAPRTAWDGKARLEAKVKTLHEQLDRAERKANVSEIGVTRVIKERDTLLAQIGIAYFNNDELVKENEQLRQSHTALQDGHDELRARIEDLKDENLLLRDRLWGSKSLQGKDITDVRRRRSTSNASRGNGIPKSINQLTGEGAETEEQTRRESRSAPGRRRASGDQSQTLVHDLASRIEMEVQKRRDEAAARARELQKSRDEPQRSISLRSRSRSKSQRRKSGNYEDRTAHRRHVSAPMAFDDIELESTTDLKLTQHGRPRASSKTFSEQDLTQLSDIDMEAVANLRRKLEEERRANRFQKRSEPDQTSRSATSEVLPRKSSLKDLTTPANDATGKQGICGDTGNEAVKIAKTVRVQSPHSSFDQPKPEEVDDVSLMSNISRRRRRTASIEGMTSAFILPDITMHNAKSLTGQSCIQHDTAKCTLCSDGSGNDVEIPTPVPVSQREDAVDMTNATIRPAQPPTLALATVIKNLQDEVDHLKIKRDEFNKAYNQHDPAQSKRRRQAIKAAIDKLTAQLEKRSDQVYKLYDVLEGQIERNSNGGEKSQQAKEDTLISFGVGLAELSGRIGRHASGGLDATDDTSGEESDDLPWEGLSDVESEEEIRGF